jgi:hypothetical protein
MVVTNTATTRIRQNAKWTHSERLSDGRTVTVEGLLKPEVSHVAGPVNETTYFCGFPVPPTAEEACQDWPLAYRIHPNTLAKGIVHPFYETRTLPVGWNLMFTELKRIGWVPAPHSLYWGSLWKEAVAKSVPDTYFNAWEWVGRWVFPSPDSDPDSLHTRLTILTACPALTVTVSSP